MATSPSPTSAVAGTLTHAGRAEPMVVALSYHGVFRTRGRAWAWFSGSGVVETAADPRRWRRRPKVERRLVVLDVLFDRPGSGSSPLRVSPAAPGQAA